MTALERLWSTSLPLPGWGLRLDPKAFEFMGSRSILSRLLTSLEVTVSRWPGKPAQVRPRLYERGRGCRCSTTHLVHHKGGPTTDSEPPNSSDSLEGVPVYEASAGRSSATRPRPAATLWIMSVSCASSSASMPSPALRALMSTPPIESASSAASGVLRSLLPAPEGAHQSLSRMWRTCTHRRWQVAMPRSDLGQRCLRP